MGNLFGELFTYLGPSWSHSCGKIVKLQPFSVYTDSFKEVMNLVDSFLSVKISFQEMTLALKSAGNKNSIHASFKSPEKVYLVKFTGTRQSDNFHIKGIGKPHYTS